MQPILSDPFATSRFSDANFTAFLERFFAGFTPRTRRAYEGDFDVFAKFTGKTPTIDALRDFLLLDGAAANTIGLAFRARLIADNLAAATINRRISSLRSLVKVAQKENLVNWRLDTPSLNVDIYRDTHVTSPDLVRALMELFDGKTDRVSLRDRAIIRLLYDLGLRRGEVVNLDCAHLNLARNTLVVPALNGRGKTKEMPLPIPTANALAEWLTARGMDDGPLFVNLDHAHEQQRLTGNSIYRIVSELGCELGVKLRPKSLRHCAITQALDITNGDIYAVQQFSRHRDPRVLLRFDKNRHDIAGEIAARLAQRIDHHIDPRRIDSQAG